MKSVHVILINDDEQQNSVGFVLGLSGHRVAMVKDLQEALNWVVNRKNTPEAFDVMVMGCHTPDSHVAATISELQRLGASLPILVVQSKESRTSSDAPFIKTPGLQHLITFCKPENIVQSVAQLFAEKESFRGGFVGEAMNGE